MEGVRLSAAGLAALAAVAGCGGRSHGVDGGPPFDAAWEDAAAIGAPVVDAAGVDADLTACPALDPSGYGACGSVLGAIFDGNQCVEVSGCDCGADCAGFFPTVEACASGCAAAGRCNTGKFLGPDLPIEVGDFCDLLEPCGQGDPSTLAQVLSVWPDLTCGGAETHCTCATTLMCYAQTVTIDADVYRRACAASLLPTVACVSCTVFL
jgi:hypothetical protein